MPELDGRPPGERAVFVLIEALEALRDGLRPFVVGVLQEKEGPGWWLHPRVQRLVPAPPAPEGEPAPAPGEPVLDLALLLKLIGSDAYWHRTFRPRLPGISHWQIDSLRELRNRVAHDDGEDPLLSSPSLAQPYLATMEQLLRVVGSERVAVIGRLQARLRRSRRRAVLNLLLGRSRWSLPVWLALAAGAGAMLWLVDYGRAPRLARRSLVIGTPDRRLERYLPLEQHLEARLRPSDPWRALRGERIDVRLEGARTYPEAVAQLRSRHWDVLLGFSPVVSLEALAAGYRPIGRMFPQAGDYRAILFTRADSPLRSLEGIGPSSRLALGDFFSATKYYVPMSLLRGRSARVSVNLSTEEIVAQVRAGRADVGAMAGDRRRFAQRNPGLRILATSPPLPSSLLALSPDLADLDRNRLQRALLEAPAAVRGAEAANYAAAPAPDYRPFARRVAEGKAFSACLQSRGTVLDLRCPAGERIELVEGWIDDARPEGERVRIDLTSADGRTLRVLVPRPLLEQSAVFGVLHDLRGRSLRLLSLQRKLAEQPLLLETPHQIEISP